MSYFEFTHADMGRERAAGIEEARREIGDVLAALADDTSRKLDEDTAPRQILLEDLLKRIVTLTKAFGSDAAGLFRSLESLSGDNPIMPLDGEEIAEHPFEASYSGVVCGAMVMRDGGGDSCGLPLEKHMRRS